MATVRSERYIEVDGWSSVVELHGAQILVEVSRRPGAAAVTAGWVGFDASSLPPDATEDQVAVLMLNLSQRAIKQFRDRDARSSAAASVDPAR